MDVAESTFGANGGTIDNAYNEYYNNQLEEILSNPKYGNKGHFVEVWMDGANGYNNVPQTYNFEKWFATIQKYEGKEAGYKQIVCCSEQELIQQFAGSEMKMDLQMIPHGQNQEQ